MVQKYQSPVRVYKYPFELVMAAYERRFPTCPLIPVFVDSEITSEFKSNDGGFHIVERRCKLNVDIPYLLKKIIGVDYAFFIQKNSLDRCKRVLNIEARNESFSTRIVVNENCVYYVHPENPSWTCFEQSGSLDIKSFFGFESTVEKLAVKQYSQNIAKGKEIIEHFVKELASEGITHIPPFESVSKMEKMLPDKQGHGGDGTEKNDDVVKDTETPRICSTMRNLTLTGEEHQFQLDAEYIERNLGHLTPLQESRLIQLRNCVAELQRGKIPSDAMLLRFLRARDFNVDKAREMLCESLVWRKKHQIDRVLAEYQPPPVAREYFAGGWHQSDKEGRPLYLLRLGQLDVKGLLKSLGSEGLLKLVLYICEEGLKRCQEATVALGRPVQTWTLLVDMDGLTMRHLWRPGIQTLLRITQVVEANYPETLGRVLITRAPRVFPILWTVVSTFIDEVTRSKILFHVGTDWSVAGGLSDIVDEDNIPDFLGGAAKTDVCEGGLVPKHLYMTEDGPGDKERGLESPTLWEDNIYHCVTFSKGQVHEVVICNEDAGSVICWDFDVMRHDVVFSVIRTHHPILKSVQGHGTNTQGPLELIQTMKPLADGEHRSVIDKTWKEDVDFFYEESLAVCQEGESIQGSHVASHKGAYILQWRLTEPGNNGAAHSSLPNPRDIIDSLTSPKAKVMYFYELLRSDDFKVNPLKSASLSLIRSIFPKGSKTSLESCQSGFSLLSQQTSHSAASTAVSR